MHYRKWSEARSREVARMNRVRSVGELSFEDRMRRVRRSRRRVVYRRLTDNALWIALVAALGIVVATQLLAAVGRA